MLAGVPQGSTLSPLLYNLYTSDIPRSVRTELSVYADDIWIYHKNRSARFAHLAVQRHLNEIGRWTNEWRIEIKAENTKAVVFSKRTRLQLPVLKLHGEDIDYVPRHPYLGVILDRGMNSKPHVEELRGKAHGSLTALSPVVRPSLSSRAKFVKNLH
jgi:Reverse transcriptase (RNA-dependent DNA polymerase).